MDEHAQRRQAALAAQIEQARRLFDEQRRGIGRQCFEPWRAWSLAYQVNRLLRMLERARREDEALAEIEVWESIPEEALTGAPADLAEIRRRKARLEPRWR